MFGCRAVTQRLKTLSITSCQYRATKSCSAYITTTTRYRALITTATADMPPKKSTKRKATTPPSAGNAEGEPSGNGSAKKAKISSSSSDPLRQPHDRAQEAEDNGIVLRKYYPHEMHNRRALAYNSDELPRPIELLSSALADTQDARDKVELGDAVVHWFKCDLRTRDNTSLHLASEKAKQAGKSLICVYLISPQDFEAHLTAPVRVDFILRTLAVLKENLGKLDIPLYVETVEKRRKIHARIEELMGEWGAKHLFANMEYEVDELRREARMVRSFAEKGWAMDVVHDTCVVKPGELTSGSGKQYSVYSPWFRSWVAHVHQNGSLLDLFDSPGRNPAEARKKYEKLFDSKIPSAPENKKLSEEERKRFGSMWPAGEHEAAERLKTFADSRIGSYKDRRNFPSENGTSSLSVHFASGTLSARTAVKTARDHNKTKKLDGGHEGIQTWISEVAWRDFYKHVLVNWPYVCMNKPFKPEYTNIEWEYNDEQFTAWKEGKTGYPIVDAAMRQLNHTGYMHNRCRMIAASFLAKDLLIDWRMGEQYFMLRLVDGDFASNNGGWGFSASTGVDPQPYFRIFNPLLQSEKFDPDGEYIRKWVPELKGVKGKAIHEPYERGEGKAAKSKGYPDKVVVHKESRERTLARYKAGLGRDTA